MSIAFQKGTFIYIFEGEIQHQLFQLRCRHLHQLCVHETLAHQLLGDSPQLRARGLPKCSAILALHLRSGLDELEEEHELANSLSTFGKWLTELAKEPEDLRQHQLQKCSAILAVQLRKLHEKLRNRELEDNYDLHKWLRELEKFCEYIGKVSISQLRACQKVRHQLTLANWDRTEKNLDDELATKFDDTKQFHIRSLDNVRFHIRSLDNMRFHIRSLDNMRFRA